MADNNQCNNKNKRPTDSTSESSSRNQRPCLNDSFARPHPYSGNFIQNHALYYPPPRFYHPPHHYPPRPPYHDKENPHLSGNIGNNGQFIPDVSFSSFDNLRDAVIGIKNTYGGYFGETKQCVLTDNSTIRADGVVVYKYKCRHKDSMKCPWRCQIRMWQDGRFQVYKSRAHYHHNHPISPIPSHPRVQHGLNPSISRLVETYLRQEQSRGTCILSIRCSDIVEHVVLTVRKDPSLVSIKFQVDDKDYKDRLIRQIRDRLYHQREKFIEGIICVHRIPNNDTLCWVLAYWRLHVPKSYVPSSTYASPTAISNALNLPSEYHMIIFDLTNGSVYDRYKRKVVGPQPAKQKKFVTDMECSFFVTSCNGLFQLLTAAKRRVGTRQVGADGVGGFVNNSSTVVAIGTNAVSYCFDDTDVMSSLRCYGYLHAGGERKHPYCVLLYRLREICLQLFGVRYEIDWGSSDHAPCFHSSHVLFKQEPSICDSSDVQLKSSCPSLFARQSTQNHAAAVAVVTQPSQPTQLSQVEDMDLDAINQELRSVLLLFHEEHSDSWNPSVATLNCYFHVMQNFKNRSSFASEFKDTTLCDPSKNDLAYRHVQAIHRCKTIEQRQRVTQLVLKHWRELLGEKRAADKFEEQYCTPPYNNWNYNCTGEGGVYPIQNPNESSNKVNKDQVTLNVSLPRFLVETAPTMLKKDYVNRSDPCIIKCPDDCSVLSVGLTGFLQEGIDIIEMGEDEEGKTEGYLVNLRHRIGHKITQEDIRLLNASLDGVDSPFEHGNSTANTPSDILFRMLKATNLFCHVTWNEDGNIIGDCEDCIKKLGWKCPAAAFVRNKHGQLRQSLEDKRKVPISSVRNTSGQYRSGPSSRKMMSIPPMKTDFPSYINSLQKIQLAHLVSYLCLVKDDNDVSKAGNNDIHYVRSMKTQNLRKLLLDFYNRNKRKHR